MHFEIVQRICSRECIWIFLCCKKWHSYMQHYFEAFSVGSHLKPPWNLPLVVLKHTIGPVYYRCSLHTMFILYLWITLDWPHWGYKLKGIFFRDRWAIYAIMQTMILHVPRLLGTINRYASNSTAQQCTKGGWGCKTPEVTPCWAYWRRKTSIDINNSIIIYSCKYIIPWSIV